jgi:hypothetical protein
MSNADKWDHSGFESVNKNDQSENYTRGNGPKKHHYSKYKDQNAFCNKNTFSNYTDNNQRKNQNSKYPHDNGTEKGAPVGSEFDNDMRNKIDANTSQDSSVYQQHGKKKKYDQKENLNYFEPDEQSFGGTYNQKGYYNSPKKFVNENSWDKNNVKRRDSSSNIYSNKYDKVGSNQNHNYQQNTHHSTINNTKVNGNDISIQQDNLANTNENIKNKKNFKNMLETLKASKSQFSKKEEPTGQDSKKPVNETNNTPQKVPFNQGNTPTQGLNMASFNSPMRGYYSPMPGYNNVMNMVNFPNYNLMNEQGKFNQGFQNNVNKNFNPQMLNLMGYHLNNAAGGLASQSPSGSFNPYNAMNMNQNKNYIIKQCTPEDFNKISSPTPTESYVQNNNFNNYNFKEGNINNINCLNNFNNTLMYNQQAGHFNPNFMMNNLNNQQQGFTKNPQYNKNYNRKYNRSGFNNQGYRKRPFYSEKNLSEQNPFNENARYTNANNQNHWKNNQNTFHNNWAQNSHTNEPDNKFSPSTHTASTTNVQTIIQDEEFEKITSSNEVSLDVDQEEPTVLQVILKLNDRVETININKNEDSLMTAKEFCKKNGLADCLIIPINEKIKQAFKSMDQVLESNMRVEETDVLKEVENLYKQADTKISTDDPADETLNLSCFTELDTEEVMKSFDFELYDVVDLDKTI